MARIPIEIRKIKRKKYNAALYKNSSPWGEKNWKEKEITEYQISIIEKGKNWNKTYSCDLDELTRLRDEISQLIENTTTSEKLNISNEKAVILEKYYVEDEICQNCEYKLSDNCLTCIFELQSPLERKLFIEFKRKFIRFNPQYALNWKGENISVSGKSYDNPKNNFKDVLTVVDFYIEKKGVKLCVYTDGHSFHEKTEEQAQRDKRIDRKLQEFGYTVLRYTGKDVRENVESILTEINKWIK